MERIHVSPYVTTTYFNGSAVLLDLKKNVYYALNDSAACFWKSFLEINSFEGALKEVLKIYGSPSDVIRKDMEVLVIFLLQSGLIEKEKSKPSIPKQM